MERNLIPPNYQGCKHAKEEMQKKKSQRMPKSTVGRVFSSSHTTPKQSFAGVLCSNTQQQPQLPTVTQACATTVDEMSPPAPLRHNQQQVVSQSDQAPNANSSSVNNMFKVVATIFQQIMTELNGNESEEDRIMVIAKIVLKLMKRNGCWS
jgi:hypothetical protein